MLRVNEYFHKSLKVIRCDILEQARTKGEQSDDPPGAKRSLVRQLFDR